MCRPKLLVVCNKLLTSELAEIWGDPVEEQNSDKNGVSISQEGFKKKGGAHRSQFSILGERLSQQSLLMWSHGALPTF